MSKRYEAGLRALVGQIFGRDPTSIGLDDDLLDVLGLDSLEALRLLAAAEMRYGFRFSDEQLSEVRTLRQMLDAVEDGVAGEEPGDL